jgi:hypothetical protein
MINWVRCVFSQSAIADDISEDFTELTLSKTDKTYHKLMPIYYYSEFYTRTNDNPKRNWNTPNYNGETNYKMRTFPKDTFGKIMQENDVITHIT